MARVTCRCGETLEIRSDDPERVNCPRCGARIRVRRRSATPEDRTGAGDSDGYLRFNCPCGRRLKVRAAGRPEAGKCPDCGRVVPVPESAWLGSGGKQAAAGRSHPEARTEEMDADDLARLEQWAARHLAASSRPDDKSTAATQPTVESTAEHGVFRTAPPSVVKIEAGLRVCPRCGKPVHLSATTCRDCGAAVPRR